MPAMANIVVNDAATTPVAHTFAPVTSNGGKAEFANRNATTIAGWETAQIEVKKPSVPGGAYRVSVGLGDPVEVITSGVTTIDHINSGQVVLNFSAKSTTQERKDVCKLLAGFLTDTNFVLAVSNLEPFYG